LPRPRGAEVLASFPDGGTAVVRWSLGQGHVVLCGGLPGLDTPDSTGAFSALLAACGLTPPLHATGSVEAALLARGDTRYVLLRNAGQTATVTRVTLAHPVAARVSDLVARCVLGDYPASAWTSGFQVSLKPNEVTALALDPPALPARTFGPLDYPAHPQPPPPIPIADSEAPAMPITQWLVAGPLPNPDGYKGASFYASRPPAGDWTPSAAWKPAQADGGHLSLLDIFPDDDHSLAYAMTDLVVPAACTARLEIGADYGLYLWLDGQPLFDIAKAPRGQVGPAEEVLDVPLHAGRNRLGARIAPGSRGWSFWLSASAPGLRNMSPQTTDD